MAHLPSSCLLVAEKAPLKKSSSVVPHHHYQPEMISKEINPKNNILFIV
jgi:hypothetical protein